MINVAAMGIVKNWPVAAEYGFGSLFFYLLAAVIFFLPVSLVAAELATGWPRTGGVFVWVKEAFGHRVGFLAVWLFWLQNVVWYPTALSFVVVSAAYLVHPSIAGSRLFLLFAMWIIFWAATLANFRGMRISGWISSIGVILGNFVPALIIIPMGLYWIFSDRPMQIAFSSKALLPNMSSIEELVMFTGIMLSLMGMEMSAVHARDVKHPNRDYPRAILLSGFIVLILSILGAIAIATVIPKASIDLAAGAMQAFAAFVHAYHLSWLVPYLAAAIAIGGLGSLSTWIVGPSKGLLAAARSGDLPPRLRRVNASGMPVPLLLVQAGIVTLFSLLFLYMQTVSMAYWILIALTSQLYLIMYVLMFAAAIALRYRKPHVPRAYMVPGGLTGLWIVAGLGMLASVFAFILGFFPPTELHPSYRAFYVTFLLLVVVLACLIPSLILLGKKPSWSHPLAHEQVEE